MIEESIKWALGAEQRCKLLEARLESIAIMARTFNADSSEHMKHALLSIEVLAKEYTS